MPARKKRAAAPKTPKRRAKPAPKKPKPKAAKRRAPAPPPRTKPSKKKKRGRTGRAPARTILRRSSADDRVTPVVPEREEPESVSIPGFRPSRILTTRPRPELRQFDPAGGRPEPPRTLQPWEVEVDDLAELMAARAAEEQAADGDRARMVSSPKSAKARIAEARAAGWKDAAKPAVGGLPDDRIRLVHPTCKYIDGRSARDVTLSIHLASGRATLLLEGGPRLRSATWRMREEPDLPTQVSRLLDDPARFLRAEVQGSRDLIAELDAADAAVADALHGHLGDKPAALQKTLRKWIDSFAAIHASYGLPATVEGAWERFGARRGSVLERLGSSEDGRARIADLFDAALE